jgi:hypothetical protein
MLSIDRPPIDPITIKFYGITHRMNVVVPVDQDVFDGLTGVGVEINAVLLKWFPVDVVLGKGCHVLVGPHGKDDGFGLGDLMGLYGFVG